MLRIMAWVLMAPAVCAAGDVPETYRQVARDHGIPSTLFYAVALAESGKRIDGLQMLRPWPWTLNVHGAGRYYPSRRTAMAALQEALASGRSSVDVGLMQVNWRYHRAALGRIEDALDPYRNLNVAATILTACYQSRQDWWAAVGCYHAPNNPERAMRYRQRVRDIWLSLTATG
jgi:soluble lytic murein transglycosylase-like protein